MDPNGARRARSRDDLVRAPVFSRNHVGARYVLADHSAIRPVVRSHRWLWSRHAVLNIVMDGDAAGEIRLTERLHGDTVI
jgi:hypothetical protein